MSRTLYRSLSQLEVWQPYTILQCSEKRNGNILLYLRGSKEEREFRGSRPNMATLRAESPQTFLKVFLPRRYGVLFSDEELRRINEKTLSLSLKYLGTNTTTNSYILEIEQIFL